MDLEILQEEKLLTETEHSNEIQSLFAKIKTLEQDKMRVGQEAYDLKFKVQKLDSDKAQEIQSLQSFVENLENQSKQNEQRWDRRLEDLKSRYENEILPELANSHNRVVSQIKLEVDQIKNKAITLESENMTLTQRVQTLESDLSLSRKETDEAEKRQSDGLKMHELELLQMQKQTADLDG